MGNNGKIDKLLLLCANRLSGASKESYDAFLGATLKYICWLHGAAVFLGLYCLQLTSESSWRYMIGMMLVYLLWDGGQIHKAQLWFTVCLNLHHLGVIIAFLHQSPAHPSQAMANTLYFSWIWSIHSFGFFQDLVLPRLGFPKLQDGQKYWGMDLFRHCYAAGSVCCYHLYLNGSGQPGIGWNYQTGALSCMLFGRFVANNNAVNVDFLRRIEAPGCIFLTVAHLSETSIAVALVSTAFIGFITWKVVKYRPIPAQYLLTPAIQQLLASYPLKDPEPDEKELGMITRWWDGHENWSDQWPLHRAALVNDLDGAKNLLKEHEADTKMTDWYDSSPLAWATYLGHLSMMALLVQKGANPYYEGTKGQRPITSARHPHTKELYEKVEALALKESPPVDGMEASLGKKVWIALKQL